MRRECRERFPRHRLHRIPLVCDPDMHHSTCVTHVPWCIPGSLTRGGGENVPGIPGAWATRNFTYLVKGPWEYSCFASMIQFYVNPHGVAILFAERRIDIKTSILSGKTSYRQISWSFEAKRSEVLMSVSLWSLTGISASLLPMCQSKFTAIGKVETRISRLRDFIRSKPNIKCGRSPRFGRPTRSGDSGCWLLQRKWHGSLYNLLKKLYSRDVVRCFQHPWNFEHSFDIGTYVATR